MHALIFAGLMAAAVAQTPQGVIGTPAPDPNAPPVIDIAMRVVRASVGGSSTARSAARGDEPAYLYSGLGPCVTGAAAEDPAHEHSITWRASGRVRSVERGIAVADVEWQRIEYRPAGIAAGPRVRMTLTLPLGERVAVDFVDVSGSVCRMDGLIFEIGVAPDHGARLAMSGEGRMESVGRGGGGGGVGRRIDAPQTERQRQGAEAARAATVVTRPMPPRQYDVDVWLVPEAAGNASAPPLSQRMSQTIGGTGGRFVFPPIPVEAVGNPAVAIEVSALVIPVDGERLVVAITRHVTPGNGAAPVSSGWIKAVPLPQAGDVLAFEMPAPVGSEASLLPRQGYGLRVKIGRR